MRKKKAIYNISTTLFLKLIIIIFNFIIPNLIINKYGSAVNGLVSSITQFLSYIVLLEIGIGGVVRSLLYKPLSKNDNNKISEIIVTTECFFKKIAYAFIIYVIILCFIYPIFVSTNFDRIYTISLILIISISNFCQYYFGLAYQILLDSDQKLYVSNITQIVTYFFNLLIIVLLIQFNCSIQIVKLFSSLIFIVKPLFFNYYVKKKYNINKKIKKNNLAIEERWDGFGHQFAAMIHNNTDIALLTIFTNIAQVSVYSLYALVTNGIKTIIQSITSSLTSSFGNMIAQDEKSNIKNKFFTFELFYSTLTYIMFTCTAILITPFIMIYTRGVTDVNYYRPIFAYIIVTAEWLYCLRDSYSMLIFAKGDFKKTKYGAFIEAIINVLISLLLVNKYGLIGVAIGTLCAMLYRTIDYIVYVSKNLIEFSLLKVFFRYFVNLVMGILIIIIVKNNLPNLNNFFEWTTYSILLFFVISIIYFILNILTNINEFKKIVNAIKERKNIK